LWLSPANVICSMAINLAQYQSISAACAAAHATLVAVSKTKPASDIEALYAAGQRDFGENYVQELADKAALLPPDIRWHFIGHLQSNKVKYIAPFVHLIHGVDSLKLLVEINKQAAKQNRIIDCLLQVHIAREETKFGFDATELAEALQTIHQSAENFAAVRVRGLMGMASFSDDQDLVRAEFEQLRDLFQQSGFRRETDILSMGMSGDYPLALAAGSNLVRIGSLLFGARG
jgi:pyridoxal phosphate enzyme (YggS family)